MLREGGSEQRRERPDDPDILLQEVDRPAAHRRGDFKRVPPIVGGEMKNTSAIHDGFADLLGEP